MRSWEIVLRNGFIPQWPTERLQKLLAVMDADDARLIQGRTTEPPPLMCVSDWPCKGACLVSFCSIDDPFEASVGEVEEGFAKACVEADQILGEPAACRWLLNWVDDTPRSEVFSELRRVISDELQRRDAQ